MPVPSQPFRTDYGSLEMNPPFCVPSVSQRRAQNFYWSSLRNSQQAIAGLQSMARGGGGRFGDVIQVNQTGEWANDVSQIISSLTGQYATNVASEGAAVVGQTQAIANAQTAAVTNKTLIYGLAVGGGVIALLGAIAILRR